MVNMEIFRALYENTVEGLVTTYVSTLSAEELASRLNAGAIDLISQIKAILDDGTLEDPECFRRIDAMADAFGARGIYTPRHDW